MGEVEHSVIALTIDGRAVEVADDGRSLLDVLREHGSNSAKDGCAPQGQCGCCTVLVDGSPRVSCVTPVRRVANRSVVTVDGLTAQRRDEWSGAFAATGASQCGFCTPGIICRLEGAVLKGADLTNVEVVDRALKAHICRCTGWLTIREAAVAVATGLGRSVEEQRDMAAASERATIEGGASQRVGVDVALGRGGFADDTAPADALVAVPDGDGWCVGESMFEARQQVSKVQGRRTTLDTGPPLALPEGDWAVALQTRWVEPGYLEPDAVWCSPGGEPVGPLLNGGAFGSKIDSPLRAVARRLADEHGRAVRVVADREHVVRNGPKRPPMAIGLRTDGSGVVRMARTSGLATVIGDRYPGIEVQEVDVPGPPTSGHLRAAGWAEVELALSAVRGHVGEIVGPDGGSAEVAITDGEVRVSVDAGSILDSVVLRSYVIGAAHMGLGWVRSESIAVDEAGVVHDLTMRSFGILRSSDTPNIEVEMVPSGGPPVNASDAAFVAVAAAAWLKAGSPGCLPVGGS